MQYTSLTDLQQATALAYKANDFTEFEHRIGEWLDFSIQVYNGAHYGSALHMNHIYRGLFALQNEDGNAAKLHLLRATGVPSSPVLRSFGPNMRLAQEFLTRGERMIVFQYFNGCKSFWWFPFRFVQLSRWRSAMHRGQLPDFGGNLYYNMGPVSLWQNGEGE